MQSGLYRLGCRLMQWRAVTTRVAVFRVLIVASLRRSCCYGLSKRLQLNCGGVLACWELGLDSGKGCEWTCNRGFSRGLIVKRVMVE
jgi:hypothetical protein